jgi:hypothetical protein
MSSRDDTEDYTNKSVPTDAQGIPLRWCSNNAKIPGLLEDFLAYCVMTSQFIEYFEHRAVSTNRGTIIPNISTAPYIQGHLPCNHGFENICPEISARVAATQAARAANSESAYNFPTSLPPGSEFQINPSRCKKEDAYILMLLVPIFGKNASEDSDDLIADAQGSGIALIAALRARAATASAADRAIVTATFDRIKHTGVSGELTLTSLKAFVASVPSKDILILSVRKRAAAVMCPAGK